MHDANFVPRLRRQFSQFQNCGFVTRYRASPERSAVSQNFEKIIFGVHDSFPTLAVIYFPNLHGTFMIGKLAGGILPRGVKLAGLQA